MEVDLAKQIVQWFSSFEGKTCFPQWNSLPIERGKCRWHKECAACQNIVQSIWKWLYEHKNDDDYDECASWPNKSRMDVNAAGVEQLILRAKATLMRLQIPQ